MTTTVLWDKGGPAIDPRVQSFLAGEDVRLDQHLLIHDLRATIAHVRGLRRIDVLEPDEVHALVAALDGLAEEVNAGAFVLDDRFEDGHSAIEAALTERLGDVGRRVHVGRSRNDQVMTAMRLWMRERLDELHAQVLNAAEACLCVAGEHAMLPMPGYTHLQRAVPSSVGLWMAGFAELFLDDAALIRDVRERINTCPLGTAAGYGVNLPLDREGVAAELGFARVQLNPLAAQTSRGLHECHAVTAAWQALQNVRRLAWDVSLFTTSEFGFITLPDRLTTGSSIMPNKRNPDVIELMRASAASIVGCLCELQQVQSLPSGYHRDVQLTKGPTMRALLLAAQVLALVPDAISAMQFNAQRMERAIEPAMFATDRAVELAVDGLPFRLAYQQVARELDDGAARSAQESLAARTSPGACGDLQLDVLRTRLADARERLCKTD